MDETEEPIYHKILFPKVAGKCFSCGEETLFLGEGGYVTCSRASCEAPTLTSDVLMGVGHPSILFAKSVETRDHGFRYDGGPWASATKETVELSSNGQHRGIAGVINATFVTKIGSVHAGEEFYVYLIKKEDSDD